MSRCHRAHAGTLPALGAQETTHPQLGGTGDISWGRNAPEIPWIPWLADLAECSTQQRPRERQLTPSPSSHRGKKENLMEGAELPGIPSGR